MNLQTMTMMALLGLLGVFCRYGIDQMTVPWNPTGTWVINILGSALAGIIFVLGEKQMLSESLHLSLLVGFCGGFTTFSGYALQSFLLMEKGKLSLSLVYFSLSPLTGFLATALGVLAARKLLG